MACTCVGIDVADGALYAPDSLQDLADGVLRINPRHALPDLFRAKAASYQARWPWLRVIAPDAAPAGTTDGRIHRADRRVAFDATPAFPRTP